MIQVTAINRKYFVYRGIVIAISVALILSCSSCRKKAPYVVTTNVIDPSLVSLYHISYKGKPFAGDTIWFSSDVPEGVNVTWVLMSEETNWKTYYNEHAPMHVFAERGKYTAVVIVDGDTANTKGENARVELSIGYQYDLARANKIAGLRYWHALSDSVLRQSGTVDTLRMFDDTFAITIVNDMTISVKNKLLTAQGKFITSSGEDIYSFSDTAAESPFSWETIIYHPESDSVVYYSHPYQGGYITKGKYQSVSVYGVSTVYWSD